MRANAPGLPKLFINGKPYNPGTLIPIKARTNDEFTIQESVQHIAHSIKNEMTAIYFEYSTYFMSNSHFKDAYIIIY